MSDETFTVIGWMVIGGTIVAFAIYSINFFVKLNAIFASNREKFNGRREELEPKYGMESKSTRRRETTESMECCGQVKKPDIDEALSYLTEEVSHNARLVESIEELLDGSIDKVAAAPEADMTTIDSAIDTREKAVVQEQAIGRIN